MPEIKDTPYPGVPNHEGDDAWIRLPKPGARLHGLSRSTLNELTIPCAANDFKPPVRSVLIRKRNALRGIRLVDETALLKYLSDLANEQAIGECAPSHNQ